MRDTHQGAGLCRIDAVLSRDRVGRALSAPSGHEQLASVEPGLISSPNSHGAIISALQTVEDAFSTHRKSCRSSPAPASILFEVSSSTTRDARIRPKVAVGGGGHEPG